MYKRQGFIEQMTHPEEIEQLFKNEKITFYIGFDPTADSLHVGHFLTVMAMSCLLYTSIFLSLPAAT